MTVIHEIVDAKVVAPRRIAVAFDDGEAREVDLTELPDGPVFEPLADPDEFARVRVDRDAGTIGWPSGVDLDPIAIYERSGPLVVRDLTRRLPTR